MALQGGQWGQGELGGLLERPAVRDGNDAEFCVRHDIFRKRAVGLSRCRVLARHGRLASTREGEKLTADAETCDSLADGPHTL